jgi:hypothetical protein
MYVAGRDRQQGGTAFATTQCTMRCLSVVLTRLWLIGLVSPAGAALSGAHLADRSQVDGRPDGRRGHAAVAQARAQRRQHGRHRGEGGQQAHLPAQGLAGAYRTTTGCLAVLCC